jgi:hypothetical protein
MSCAANVLFAQDFNEEKTTMTNFLKRMYNSSPFEGVKVVEDYDNKYFISVVSLDQAKYPSSSTMIRVAQVKARQQASTFFNGSTISSDLVIRTSETKTKDSTTTVTEMLESIKENSIGFVQGMELLSNFPIEEDKRMVFIYFRLLGKQE